MATTPAVKEKETIRDLITSEKWKRQFKMALPRHLTPDRFVRVALTTINKNPKLGQCTTASLLSCLVDCSQLGLEPDGRLVHLIPYGDQCTVIVDYKGLVRMARNSGEIDDVHADVVGDGDKFTCSYGSNGKLEHIPNIKGRGKIIAAYSFVKLKDGSSSYEMMTIDEVKAIQQRSKAKDNGPWKTDWNEMAKKTVFRRHSKWLPVSSEKFQKVNEVDFDNVIDVPGEEVPLNVKPEVAPPTSKSGTRAALVQKVRELAEIKQVAPVDYELNKWEDATDEKLEELIATLGKK